MIKKLVFTFKVCLVGKSSVGKTRFACKLKNLDYDNRTTIGVDCYPYHCNFDQTTIKAQIYDTAGRKRYQSDMKSLFTSSNAFMLFYDITNRQSFDKIPKLIHYIREQATGSDFKVVICLVGNKTDLESKRVVSTEEGAEMARNYRAIFEEVSSENGSNVEKSIKNCLIKVLRRFTNEESEEEVLNEAKQEIPKTEDSNDDQENDQQEKLKNDFEEQLKKQQSEFEEQLKKRQIAFESKINQFEAMLEKMMNQQTELKEDNAKLKEDNEKLKEENEKLKSEMGKLKEERK